MSAPNEPIDTDNIPDAVVDLESKGFPVVWLLPLVAVLVGGWLIYKTLSEKGPEITILFETASGIEAGKTRIKYRDVTVGEVNDISFSHNLTDVLVTATMEAGASRYLTEETRFWVVRPRLGVGEISGLGTLVSGAYIEMEPHESGKPQREFRGLETPPVVTADKEGTSYRFRARKLGSLSVGSPIYFKQFNVGEITDYQLAEDHSYVDIGFFIYAPHDQFIREGTRFWNAGGINVSMSAQGIEVEMESLASLLQGGIAYETLEQAAGTPVAAEGTAFHLYDNHTQSLEQPITITQTFVTRFSGSVRGLSVGAPVEFRGIRVGTVKAIEIGKDPNRKGITIPVVLIDFEPQRIASFVDIDDTSTSDQRQEAFESDIVQRVEHQIMNLGLRARLQIGNLVTGQLFVDLDFFPDADPVTLVQHGKYPEIPTLPNPLEGILSGINKIIDKLEQANIEETLTNLNELMVSSNKLVSSLGQNAPALAAELQATIEEAHGTLSSLREMASTDGEIGNELYNALTEITAAARSIRVMSEYLERHPEALIKGKGN